MMLKDQEKLLDRIRFKGKGTPHRTTSLRRGVLGIKLVNEILRAPALDSVKFALAVVRCLYVYEADLNIPKYSLDKALVSLCDKMFTKDMFEEAEARIRSHLHKITGIADLHGSLTALCGMKDSDPLLNEVVVGYLIVRFREYGLFEEKSGLLVERVDERLRSKGRKVFGELLKAPRESPLERKTREAMSNGWIERRAEWNPEWEDLAYLRENYALVSYVFDVPKDLDVPHIQLRRNFSIGYFSRIESWNRFAISQ
ncbi:separase [Biomphalaria pfeifferi]|uniref:Separase n=1 Tax=Biomphalaria pfeifferi TaxID=112525 RepID=A0AAD8ANZ9_BIOPF|nr:separase [Biomphalaria pfeifferi]